MFAQFSKSSLPTLQACTAISLFLTPLSQGQDAPTPHQSSLGIKFASVPGTTVQFATTETRLQDFKAFVQASGYTWTFTPHFSQSDDHPVVGVNLQDASAFCKWLTDTERNAGSLTSSQLYRLPTDTEWSAAGGMVRARKPGKDLTAEESLGDQRRFPWGLSWPPPAGVGNLAEGDIPTYKDDFRHTAPVGKFAPSSDGLFDIAGNVWEWTSDPDSKSGPTTHLRGASWAYFNEESLHSSYLYEVPPDIRSSTIGFRLVFEDRQLTSRLIAESQKARETELRTGRDQMLSATQSGANLEELKAMRERLAGAAASSSTPAPIPSNLTSAKPGEPHTNSLGMTLLPIPGSKTLVSKTEVTAGPYEAFLKDTKQTWTDKPSHISTSEHPVAGIPWSQASAFCEWLTKNQQNAGLIPKGSLYRLPTDIEWSAAAGLNDEPDSDPSTRNGKNTTHFPWKPATTWPPPLRAANLDAPKIPGYADPHPYTCPVTSNEPNELGFFELGGNVAEWCADPWPDTPDHRVYRGGSWLSSSRDELLTSKRSHAPLDTPRGNVGFRCALELATPAP